jgi:hypothetical protein
MGIAPEGANRVVLFLQTNKTCNPGAEATFKKVTFEKEPGYQRSNISSVVKTALEWIEKNNNQGLGLGRILNSERPIALARLDNTDPEKARLIRFTIAALNMPILGGGLRPISAFGNLTQAAFEFGIKAEDWTTID